MKNCILTQNANCVETIVNCMVLIIVDIYDFTLRNNVVCKMNSTHWRLLNVNDLFNKFTDKLL